MLLENLEKTASPYPKECLEIARVAKERGLEVIACHVLHHTPFYRKLKETLDSCVIGKLMMMQANEQVQFWP